MKMKKQCTHTTIIEEVVVVVETIGVAVPVNVAATVNVVATINVALINVVATVNAGDTSQMLNLEHVSMQMQDQEEVQGEEKLIHLTMMVIQ